MIDDGTCSFRKFLIPQAATHSFPMTNLTPNLGTRTTQNIVLCNQIFRVPIIILVDVIAPCSGNVAGLISASSQSSNPIVVDRTSIKYPIQRQPYNIFLTAKPVSPSLQGPKCSCSKMKVALFGTILGVGSVAGQLITSVNTLAPGTTVICFEER